MNTANTILFFFYLALSLWYFCKDDYQKATFFLGWAILTHQLTS